MDYFLVAIGTIAATKGCEYLYPVVVEKFKTLRDVVKKTRAQTSSLSELETRIHNLEVRLLSLHPTKYLTLRNIKKAIYPRQTGFGVENVGNLYEDPDHPNDLGLTDIESKMLELQRSNPASVHVPDGVQSFFA